VIQCGDGFRFSLEAFAELRGRNLDRDIALLSRIVRFPHLAHAAFSGKCDAFIRAEFVAWRERHLDELAKFNPSRRK